MAATYEFRMAAKGLAAVAAVADVKLPNLELSSPAVEFGMVALGSPVQQTVVLTNTGAGPAVLSIGSLAAPFALTHNCPATLAPQASCELVGTFTAADTVRAQAMLSVSATGGAPAQVTFAGSGQSTLSIQGWGGYQQFLDVPTGRTIQRDFYITNTSSQPVTISRPVLTGTGYSTLLPCMTGASLTLAPGAACRQRVQFSTAVVSSYPGTLAVSQTDGGTPTTYALNATGVVPVYSSVLTTGSTLQISNSTNWKVWVRAEARIDAAAGLIVVDTFLTSSGTGGLPIGDYGMNLTGPNGSIDARHKIVSHLSNTRVSNAVPVAPGNYAVGDLAKTYQLRFTVDASRSITSYSLTLNGAAAGTVSLTQTMD
jgi:hypothetical protein